jgi:nitrogen-specific signal transduction histidine kinase/ActR/RegA family two-component response regulator
VIASVINVSERAEQLARQQQLQKMEAMGRLTAGVAHDFNNLLQAQMASLEMLLDMLADHQAARERVTLALDVVERGARLTQHLLSYSRKQVLHPVSIEVADFLAEIGRILPPMLGSRINLRIDCASDVGGVFADVSQLSTAIINLAINARDAMPDGGTLCLDARRFSALADHAPAGLASGSYVAIGVTDSGTGIDAATIAQIFEPFFTTKGTRGTGLGLSMVQGFARQSQGDIVLTSSPGKGTRAELWLPAATLAPPSRHTKAPKLALQAAGRVLLVDDSADVRLVLGTFLSSAGFTVSEAAGGELALARLQGDEAFDVLVTDYSMPGLNGRELIAHCRACRPGLPVLLISGVPTQGQFDDPEVAVQILAKPFRRDELVRRVKNLIEGKSEYSDPVVQAAKSGPASP